MNKHQLPAEVNRKRLLRISSTTNPHFGKNPENRSAPELLENGCIILDKPSGPTSHQVVAWVKEILTKEKAGHGGTLDPAVTGILPTALGDATRALQVLLLTGKEYVGVMKLHGSVSTKKLKEVCNTFIGEIHQIPPVRSAVKRVKRKRTIYYLDILEKKGTEVLFCVGCEAGTYIRTLCVDIGKKLGCNAHLSELRRTKVGKITENVAVTLQEVKDAYQFWKEDGEIKEISKIIKPMEFLLQNIPALIVRDSAVDALCHGANLAIPGVIEVDTDLNKGDTAAVFTQKGEGVALVTMALSTEEILERDTGICGDLERVLMNKGTYPSFWKKS